VNGLIRRSVVGIAVAALTFGGLAVASITTQTGSSTLRAVAPAAAARTAFAFDANDPYNSGCVHTAYIANSTGLFDQFGNRLLTIQNWYSRGCNTNWGLAYNYAVHSSMVITYPNPENGHLQCEPTNCVLGVGLGSPMWTDMVNGTNRITVCGYAVANSDRLGYSACTTA